MVIISK